MDVGDRWLLIIVRQFVSPQCTAIRSCRSEKSMIPPHVSWAREAKAPGSTRPSASRQIRRENQARPWMAQRVANSKGCDSWRDNGRLAIFEFHTTCCPDCPSRSVEDWIDNSRMPSTRGTMPWRPSHISDQLGRSLEPLQIRHETVFGDCSDGRTWVWMTIEGQVLHTILTVSL